MLAELPVRGIDAVFEQHGARRRTTDFRTGRSLGHQDPLIELVIELAKPNIKPGWMSQQDYDTAPSSLIIRELQAGHNVLMTTLLSAEDTAKTELQKLYPQRWPIEVDLRPIKTTLTMATFSGNTPDMIEKERWLYLLAYNLMRLLMAQGCVIR